jgi:hypothetical protein
VFDVWTGLQEDVMASRFFFPLAFSSYQRGPLTALQRYFAVMWQFWRYRRMANPVKAGFADMELWLTDNFEAAGKADHYFYQDTWFARKMFSERPLHHIDVGSLLGSIGVISQFVPITYIDLRPLRISLPGLKFTRGSLMALPFASATVESLSSLHVVEHCGLGRYGDDLDASGTAKACKEMLRVLKPGASLYVAVPTAAQSTTCFNAHRIFAPDCFLEFFRGIEVIEESYVTEDGMCGRNEYNALGLPFSVGCFHLRKL